jgi:hypothetical protein
MRLKGTVRILEDNGDISEVPGELFPYEYNGHKFELMVHESVQPWSPNVMDISEVSTGCRCTSTDKAVSLSTKADVIKAMNEFIEIHGLRNFQAQIKKRKSKVDLTR